MLRRALTLRAAEAGAAADIDALTTCFILMLDGIWLEQSTNPGNITPRRANRICWYWLDAALVLRFRKARALPWTRWGRGPQTPTIKNCWGEQPSRKIRSAY